MARSKAPKIVVERSPRRVLIADDHIDGGRTLREILVQLGYDVRRRDPVRRHQLRAIPTSGP